MSPQRSGYSIRKRFRESWRSLGRQRSNSSPQTTTLIAQLIFRTTRCVDPRLAQPPPLRFSPIALILQVIRWIRKQNTQGSPSGPALEEPTLVLGAVSAAHGTSSLRMTEWYGTPSPSCGLCTSGLSMGACRPPESILNTIFQAGAPSMRCLYALKWSVCSTRCITRGKDPTSYDISVILSFL